MLLIITQQSIFIIAFVHKQKDIIQAMHSISTLYEIASQTAAKDTQQLLASTVACVMDITQPLYREKQNNYITMIKLIDQTINPSILQAPFLTRHLTLYLIADTKEQLLFDIKIGDLLYLKKFLFYQWNQIQLQTKYYGTLQTLYQIRAGEIEDLQSFQLQKKLGKDSPLGDAFDMQFIAARITQIKTWLRVNFNHTFSPFYGVKVVNNYCSSIQPFCMILKSLRFQLNEFQSYMFMNDSNSNIFYMDIKQFAHVGLQTGEWVYLRGIKHITVDRQIVLTLSGNVIRVPQIFSQQYQLQANYQAIYRKTSKTPNQKKESTALTYISLFEQKPSTVKMLFDLQGMQYILLIKIDKYRSTSRKQDIILQSNYLIRGIVVKYQGRMRLYHTDYQMIVHDQYLDEVPTQQKKEIIQDKKLAYIFQGTLSLIDRSINSKKQTLKIKLFTNDRKSTFFDQKELQKLNSFIGKLLALMKGHSDCNKRVGEALGLVYAKLEKLKQLSSFQNPAALVLEPVRSDELIYRLINTKIA